MSYPLYPWFQSLFSWMMVSNPLRVIILFCDLDVSILVFLDDGLEHYSQLKNEYPVYPTFQSLFSWMMVSNNRNGTLDRQGRGFQSLFSWMMVSNERELPTRGDRPDVSILVFLDDGLELGREWVRAAEPEVSILVFLDDGLEQKQFRPPCAQILLFQSLFSWMMVSNTLAGRYGFLVSRFQSLFSWMMVSNSAAGRPAESADPVSILVFLDDGLERRDAGGDRRGPDVSILVFLDDGLELSLTHPLRIATPGFNPCFLG